jgi:hypothetical protein
VIVTDQNPIPDDLAELDDLPPDPVPALRPQPKPIGARRLDQAKAFLLRKWAPPNDAVADLIILWCAGCHMTDQEMRLLFMSYPRLFVGTKGPGAGKSTLLRLLAGPINGQSDGLAPRGEWTSDPSAPSLRALLHGQRAAIFLDQADTKQGNGDFPAETKTILLQGYMKGATVTRGGNTNTGKVNRYRVDGPICMAGLWDAFLSMPNMDDVRSRTLMLLCGKRRPTHKLERLDWRDDAPTLQGHHDALAAWAETVKHEVAAARPSMEGFDDRERDITEPLIAVADAAGGDWPERARNAVRVVCRGATDEMTKPEPRNPFEVLMRDLGLVWAPEEDRLPTREIVERLRELPNSAWSRFRTPQDAGRELVKILRPEGVEPSTFRMPQSDPVKGYWRDELIMKCGLELAPLVDPDEDPFG